MKRASRWSQMTIYLQKCFRIFTNENGWKSFISTALIVILISMVTGKDFMVTPTDTNNGAFALMCGCIWCGIFNSIRSICRERSILRHEHRTGLHMSSYVMAHWLFEACICLGEALIVIILIRIMNIDHFTENGILFPSEIEYFLTFFLIIFSADCLGLVISAVVHDENTAMTVMPFALIIQLIMSGMIFELKGVTEVISYFTISRWGQNVICAIADYNALIPIGAPIPAKQAYEATVGNLFTCWGVLILFTLAYAAIAIISLEFIDHD